MKSKVWSEARVYSDANEIRGQRYWDYENTSIEWKANNSQYEVECKVGRGKYSEVFQGVQLSTRNKIVIKMLKPVKKKKIKREITILANLSNEKNPPTAQPYDEAKYYTNRREEVLKYARDKVYDLPHNGHENIITLLDVVRDPISKTPALIFEHIDNTEFRRLYASFSDLDIRYYMFELLKASFGLLPFDGYYA